MKLQNAWWYLGICVATAIVALVSVSIALFMIAVEAVFMFTAGLELTVRFALTFIGKMILYIPKLIRNPRGTIRNSIEVRRRHGYWLF